MIRTAYLYDKDTKEYTGETMAQNDPKHPARWLLPSNATLIIPLEKQEHKAVCFGDGNWHYVDDYRNTTWYKKSDKSILEITKLGVVPTNEYTDKPCYDSRYEWSEEKQDWVLSIEGKKEDVRRKRDAMLQDSDRFVLPDFPISPEEKNKRIEWRAYLRNYTNNDKWWEQYPKTFEEYIKR